MHSINVLGMTFAFLIIFGGLVLSVFLIYLGKVR